MSAVYFKPQVFQACFLQYLVMARKFTCLPAQCIASIASEIRLDRIAIDHVVIGAMRVTRPANQPFKSIWASQVGVSMVNFLARGLRYSCSKQPTQTGKVHIMQLRKGSCEFTMTP